MNLACNAPRNLHVGGEAHLHRNFCGCGASSHPPTPIPGFGFCICMGIPILGSYQNPINAMR